jgi:predicted DNA-binding antitoxin AbrB/MazE fold protein
MEYGNQKATIVSTFMDENEKGTLRVSVKLKLATGEQVFSNIYITEKSYGIARARLKKCGWDVDQFDLSELERTPLALQGNEVEVNVWKDEYNGKEILKVDVVTDQKRVSKDKLAAVTAGLREVKKTKPVTDEDVPF